MKYEHVDVVWEDPPASAMKKSGWWKRAFIEALRDHPGKWARIVSPAGTDQHYSSVRTDFLSAGCEVRSSGIGATGQRLFMWARWPDEEDQGSS